MARSRTNFVAGLLDSSITNVATSMTSSASAGASGLPGLAAISTDTAVIVLDPDRVAGAPEVVYVTAHTGAANTATILRAQEGTTARAHNSGIKWVHSVTKADMENFGVTPSTVAVAAAAEGTSTSYARGDHTHGLSTAAPGTINPDDVAAAGVATSLARSDHTHAITAAAPGTTLNLATTNVEGVATSFARSDHVHTLLPSSTTADVATGAGSGGSASTISRGDHIHKTPANLPQGWLNEGKVTSPVTPITTSEVVLASCTATVAANRKIKASGTWRNVVSTVLGDVLGIRMYMDGVQVHEVLARCEDTAQGHNGGSFFGRADYVAGGSKVFEMRGIRLTGTGSFTVSATATGPILIEVEDVGGV